MRAEFSLSRSALFGRKVLGSAVALWLCFAATTVRGLEPVTFYDSMPNRIPPRRKRGCKRSSPASCFGWPFRPAP